MSYAHRQSERTNLKGGHAVAFHLPASMRPPEEGKEKKKRKTKKQSKKTGTGNKKASSPAASAKATTLTPTA